MHSMDKKQTQTTTLLLMALLLIAIAAIALSVLNYKSHEAIAYNQREMETKIAHLEQQLDAIKQINSQLLAFNKNTEDIVNDLTSTQNKTSTRIDTLFDQIAIQSNEINYIKEDIKDSKDDSEQNFIFNKKNATYLYEGIGIETTKRHTSFIVVKVIKGSPAEKSGLYQGDEILTIDGESVSDFTRTQFLAKMRGPKNSEVTLTYKPSGNLLKTIKKTLRRDIIEITK